jgi:putative glutamine amidotransferase
VSGTSTLDQLPEAVELRDRRFVLGVQWHPEADPASNVVAAFVAAARESRDSPPANPRGTLGARAEPEAAGTR